MIRYNNISSDDIGIIVTAVPALNRPERKADVYEVPGRSGDIVVLQDAWTDYDQPYEIAFYDDEKNAAVKSRDVAEWLYSANGYAELEDEFEPDVYRKAYFVGPVDIENIMNKVGTAEVTFRCMAKRYIKEGKTPIIINGTYTHQNPTIFTALPVITIPENEATLPITIKVNNRSMTINTNRGIVIDSEEQNAYSVLGENMNKFISGEFPKLTGGENVIEITDAAEQAVNLAMVPNEWRL